ncbi:T9SS type A sorting domain-containing protein [Flavobacterium sp.]|uniref:T9SS type A sorting domain-containing protein n=1 Tax=Flavobacterium sp. TaxID=239 RepID=UPI002FDB02E5
MKKITLLTFMFLIQLGFAQIKSTGLLTMNENLSAQLDLNQANSTVTLTLINPANSWFGLGFSTNTLVSGEGMPALVDCVVMRSTTDFSDSRTRSSGTGNPDIDASQDWTLVSNTVSEGIRTVVATRAFNTGDSNDVVFNFNDTSISLMYASPNSGNYSLVYHGSGTNRGIVNASLTLLGVDDFTLNSLQVYPNPSSGLLFLKTKVSIEELNLYSQTGAFLKRLTFENETSDTVRISNLATGIYFLEIRSSNEKIWKKIIVN